jgi:2-succinyl-6-hydroxy-2,4-cyclohexadiene-1-carboxylate synthase
MFTRGNPHDPPLIFLHGFLGAKEDWTDVFPYFEGHFYSIAIDLPGHGSAPYCENVLSALKKILQMYSPKPIIVGYSMGGRIAMQLQEYASSLVILSAHPGLATQAEREAREKIDAMWSEKILQLPFEQFLTEWYAQPIFQSFSLIDRRMKQDPQALSKMMLQLSLANQHISPISCPALFVYGEEDLKYRELYCRLPNARGIPGCGHVVHLEKPKECAQLILDWLLHANR